MKVEDVPHSAVVDFMAAAIAAGKPIDITMSAIRAALAAVIPPIQNAALERAAVGFDARADNCEHLAKMLSGEVLQAVKQLVVAHRASAAAIRALKEGT